MVQQCCTCDTVTWIGPLHVLSLLISIDLYKLFTYQIVKFVLYVAL